MRKHRAFTLVELLVVIGIIALLIAILLPSLANARATAKRTVCLTHVRGLSQSMNLYITDWNSLIPYSSQAADSCQWSTPLSIYGNSEKLRHCPEALDLDLGLSSAAAANGTATSSWNLSPSVDLIAKRFVFPRGGFAINAWLFTGVLPTYSYTTPGDEDSNFTDEDDVGQTFTAKSATVTVSLGAGYSLSRARSSSNILPTFADAIWTETFPSPSDPVPADLTIGSGDFMDEMGRVCISRHRKTVNVAFFDDHAENVPLQNLWTLPWKPGWIPPNPLPTIP